MNASQGKPVSYADNVQKSSAQDVHGDYVTLRGATYYRIRNYDAMPPFFITLISSSNHWLFISTTGGLSAGRINADHALFPYYTVDKITENSENTGSKSIFLVNKGEDIYLWEPFSSCHLDLYNIERNLYKNIAGTTLIFEEINHGLDLVYRYAWRTSDAFGFVKTSTLINRSDQTCQIQLVDGLQNILPAHVDSNTQNRLSVLLDGYKRTELDSDTGLGLYSLSSRLTDLAEPSESLRANTVWQVGLQDATYLISSTQLNKFRRGLFPQQETDRRGGRGAYFVCAEVPLGPGTEQSWHIVGEIEQDSAAVAGLVNSLKNDTGTLYAVVEKDIAAGNEKLQWIVGSADGLQESNDPLSTAHHFANVLFNVMRGGIFADQYRVDKDDLCDFIKVHNRALLDEEADFFASLPTTITVNTLQLLADKTDSADLMRLCYSYLPLTFSRRHGDPSRPWNWFAINVRKPDGSQQLDYQGNWRDIFQNWEALSYAYPEFIEGMISVFLNVTTVDGYNPYRVTRDGIDWEIPEPADPWANIGYWGDHQIIYLQKLMEVSARFYPGKLENLLARHMFSYANVPYHIKPYEDLLKNPYDTILFDWQQHDSIKALVREQGTDVKLVLDAAGSVVHVSLAEKLLTLLLAKLVNFVPEGGIWLNTQRPEWNDANNALVGKGMSVVTLCYLRRFIAFWINSFGDSKSASVSVSEEVASLFGAIRDIFAANRSLLDGPISDQQRRAMMNALGQAGSAYRWAYYQNGLSGSTKQVALSELVEFLKVTQAYVDHTLRANKRDDNLYHAYNVLSLNEDRAEISTLYEMLEGQVAILSSGMLSADESLILLQTLRHSALYREDQHSYILYPNRDLPGFLSKNAISADKVANIALVNLLIEQGNSRLLLKDVNDTYHFNGDIRNANDVRAVLQVLKQDANYAKQVEADSAAILALFEQVFHHNAFTGRSGTFFAYEGLGSIYWHMVSKLLLAVQETVLRASADSAPAETVQALVEAYYDIRAGIGFNKPPEVYGAFPTDPYSHTPAGQGAKQPGMTGMVKEEVLTRMVELGVTIEQGEIVFKSVLLRDRELLQEPSALHYFDVHGTEQQLDLPAGALGYTFCQVPVVLRRGSDTRIELAHADGEMDVIAGNRLNTEWSNHIFLRDGTIRQLNVFLHLM